MVKRKFLNGKWYQDVYRESLAVLFYCFLSLALGCALL
jgi:hypothetical protein